jgi:cell division protease FtsH
MVVRFGMTDALGPVAYESGHATFLFGQTPSWRPKTYGEGTAQSIDDAVRVLVETAFKTSYAILENNRSVLTSSAQELLTHETLNQADLQVFAVRLAKPPEPLLNAAQ